MAGIDIKSLASMLHPNSDSESDNENCVNYTPGDIGRKPKSNIPDVRKRKRL